MYRLAALVAALPLWCYASACNTEPSRPRQSASSAPVLPSPEPPLSESGSPAPGEQKSVDKERPTGSGVIVAGRGFAGTDRHDLGTLAMLADGQPVFEERAGGVVPRQPNCEVMKVGARFAVVAPHAVDIALSKPPFTNEANRCIGHPDPVASLRGRDFIAVRDLDTEAVTRASEPEPEALAISALAALRLHSSGVLADHNFAIALETSGWRHRERIYRVVEAKLQPTESCQHAACRFGADIGQTGAHQAVIVFEQTDEDKLALRFVRARVVAEMDPGEPYGMVSFVGFIAPRGAAQPWMVLLWDGGPSWTFELITSTGSTGAWRSALFGGESSTI